MVLSVLVVSWGWLRAMAATSSILRESCNTYHWPRKRPKWKIQSTVSTECLSLLHHHKVKIRKLKHCMLETVVHAVIYICIRLCPFVQFMKFSWQVYWGCLPFPPPQDHVLSEVSSMTRLSWVALHGMAHSFMSYASPFTTTRQWSVKCIKLEENNRRGKTLFRKIRNIKGTFCLKMGTIKDRNG